TSRNRTNIRRRRLLDIVLAPSEVPPACTRHVLMRWTRVTCPATGSGAMPRVRSRPSSRSLHDDVESAVRRFGPGGPGPGDTRLGQRRGRLVEARAHDYGRPLRSTQHATDG